MRAETTSDLTRTTLQIFFVGVLIAGSFWILRPFLIPLTWAATIAVSTWPLYQRIQAWLGGRVGLAVAVMTLVLLLVLVVPLYLAISAVVENADWFGEWSKTVTTLTIPQPPTWLAGVPLIGARLAELWQRVVDASPEELSIHVLPYARMLVGWFVVQVGGIGMMLVEFLLTVVIAAIFYANGERFASGLDRFACRLAGPRGEDVVRLAGHAVRAVALGVVVTALVQSVLGGIGLAIAGMRFAAILTAVMFIFGVAQLGPAPVLIPAVIWTYWVRGSGWGTALLVWSVFVGTIDNFLRPMLIKRGADLPLLLILAGVIGGLIAFGVIGLFVGPVVLAVAYTLLNAWIDDSGTRDAGIDRPSLEKADGTDGPV